MLSNARDLANHSESAAIQDLLARQGELARVVQEYGSSSETKKAERRRQAERAADGSGIPKATQDALMQQEDRAVGAVPGRTYLQVHFSHRGLSQLVLNVSVYPSLFGLAVA